MTSFSAYIGAGRSKGETKSNTHSNGPTLRIAFFIVASILVKIGWSSAAANTAVRHATRSSVSRRGRNSDMRQLWTSFGASLCFGLKTIAKTDPIPRPTKRNVIAEYKSYSLSFTAPSISTSLPCALAKYEAANHIVDRKNRATLPPALFSYRYMTRGVTSEKFRPRQTARV